jgi:hypothetical protein
MRVYAIRPNQLALPGRLGSQRVTSRPLPILACHGVADRPYYVSVGMRSHDGCGRETVWQPSLLIPASARTFAAPAHHSDEALA